MMQKRASGKIAPGFIGARNQKHAPESERALGYTVVCGIKRVIAKKRRDRAFKKGIEKAIKRKEKTNN
ncbi:hypothetical protein [Limnothrix redekei]|uniref:Uncharacterized protein n=1 Tax=Limnothrix redekei LRLZ20PSL1 TaxID=3112953 RepID=A0ABW7C5X8_9CYAN